MRGRNGYRIAYVALVAGLLWACAPRAAEAPKNTDSVANGEWLTWGGDPGYQRYSPLDQINADNAKTLEIAWRWNALPFTDRPDSNWKATPLYIDGVLYTPTGVNQAVALDPETGKEIWRVNPDPADIGGRAASVSSRALAYWTDGTARRLFHNTPDGRLISIDAATGKADPAFGANGYILLKEQLRPDGQSVPFVGSSSPPVVVGDVVIAQIVADITSANKEATPGHIRGYDVRTGKLLWTFHTIPQEGEPGNETWENDSWKYTGNAGVWSMISADPELGYIYLPVETSSHDFYGGQRPGNNLYAESIVCLNAKTGEHVWHFQIVHHGVWDYDPPAAPILHDVVKDGKTIKAVTQLTKQGMSFVFDRATGEPVWPIEERPVPQHPPGMDMKNEKLSATQPFPTKPAPYVQLGYSEDSLIDFTPALKKEALKIASNYVKGPMYTPTTPVIKGGTQGTWVQPGYGGGSNWNGAAVDPETAMMYVPNRNAAYVAALTPADPKLTNWDYIRAPTGAVPGPQGLPILKPPYAFVTATDMNRGEHVWTKPIGSAPDWIRNHPALKGLQLDWDAMGQPNVRPAPLVTKTLMFMAESGNLSGDPGGPMFRAYDKATGEVRAEVKLPERASGAPMTYLHKGRQYILIAVATQDHPAELVALALPDPNKPAAAIASAEQPTEGAAQPANTPDAPAPQTPAAPAQQATAATPDEIAHGRTVYNRACVMCHGPNGQGIPGGPPRLNGLKDVAAMKRTITAGGANMPPMAGLLTADEIDDVAKFTAAGFLAE